MKIDGSICLIFVLYKFFHQKKQNEKRVIFIINNRLI
jgi:hypothetical protein